MAVEPAETKALPPDAGGYELRISRLTVDKLGVKLYDKVSAVVAELVANGYDADAENVWVKVPLGTVLARKDEEGDRGFTIEVTDDGHGMTPAEARAFYLDVGQDRRTRPVHGARSRKKDRPVMGRKGIGKLAPFGICGVIEVISSGGEQTPDGYLTTHFFLKASEILSPEDKPVPLDAGELDGTYREKRGTTVRLSSFQPKQVPDAETFMRQLARRFALAAPDFQICVEDTRAGDGVIPVQPFAIELTEGTKFVVDDRPVVTDEGEELPVRGWLGLSKIAYKNEEMAGVRVYARGKIVATTRDFEQPAGYTNEFMIRSYLVGEVHADWLDQDEGDDLIRTDRQSILWDSEYGNALREWGAELLKDIGEAARKPRREKLREMFLDLSHVEARARERYGDEAVVQAAVELGGQIGGFAAEDELADPEYVDAVTEIVLSVAPHRALIEAFQELSASALGEEVALETLVDLFSKTRIAEVASYGQIAAERVKVVIELEATLGQAGVTEDVLQQMVASAKWLIDPSFAPLTENQSLFTFKSAFERFWLDRTGEVVELAITYGLKRPDFILVNVGRKLEIVELKAPKHAFDDDDFDRLFNYVEALDDFARAHANIMDAFPDGWRIDLIADSVAIRDPQKRALFQALLNDGKVERRSWEDFLYRAQTAHEEFLKVYREMQKRAAEAAGAGANGTNAAAAA